MCYSFVHTAYLLRVSQTFVQRFFADQLKSHHIGDSSIKEFVEIRTK